MTAIDARAAQLEISPSEDCGRRLAQDAAATLVEVSTADLRMFAKTFADVGNDGFMAAAWE